MSRSVTASRPASWHTEVNRTKGLFRDPTPDPLHKDALRTAAKEVQLLEAIGDRPGRGTMDYASAISSSHSWTLATLRQYEADGVVESSPGDRRSLLWRLT